MCKHIIDLAIRLKAAKPPPAAKDIPIDQKRKRGRPNKSSKALIIDQSFDLSMFLLSSFFLKIKNNHKYLSFLNYYLQKNN